MLKASYTSSLRPHTLVAEGRVHHHFTLPAGGKQRMLQSTHTSLRAYLATHTLHGAYLTQRILY